MLVTVAFSVSSKQNSSGSSPLVRIRSIRKSENSSSLRDWPEKLIANAIPRPASWLARVRSSAMALSTTQRSMTGIS